MNPTKISGTCGRLMCCLKYEEDAYEQIIKKMPKVGAIVETPDGQGIVMDMNLLKELLKVKLDKGNETDLRLYNVSQVKVIKDVSIKEDEADIDLEALKQLED